MQKSFRAALWPLILHLTAPWNVCNLRVFEAFAALAPDCDNSWMQKAVTISKTTLEERTNLCRAQEKPADGKKG